VIAVEKIENLPATSLKRSATVVRAAIFSPTYTCVRAKRSYARMRAHARTALHPLYFCTLPYKIDLYEFTLFFSLLDRFWLLSI
jgi:hypothetical protein